MDYLTTSEIIHINNTIHDMSHYNSKIEHIAAFNTRTDKLDRLVLLAPQHSISMNIATYYMKNIIIMQCFNDANHRTSLFSVKLFFHKNHIPFKWAPENVVKMQRDIYKLRYQIYNTYEARLISVLTEPDNSLWYYCRNCIEDVLSQ